MARPIAPDDGQQFLLPPALEDWVPLDHPVRCLREFVDQLDLPALGFAMPSGSQGRRPYAPSLFLKICLYGYFHRLRSTRKLEAACREHLGLLWLTGLITPDHNSLWRFWHENKKALRQVFKQSARLAWRTGAVGLVLQALDGAKIEAAASGHSGWSKEYMEKLLAALDTALAQTELVLAPENNEPAGYRLPAGLAQRQALRQQVKAGLAQLAADGRNHHHPVEPEARRMKQHDGFRRWTVWGLEAVRAQWSLLCTTLNLRGLYQRWRQKSLDGSKTTAAMTGRTAQGGNGLAALLKKVRRPRDPTIANRKPTAGGLAYWPPYCAHEKSDQKNTFGTVSGASLYRDHLFGALFPRFAKDWGFLS